VSALTLIVVTVVFTTTTRADAAVTTLRDALKPMAEDVLAIVVKDQRQSGIAIGDFNAPTGLDANGGPGISETLESLLNELQPGLVQKKATLSLRGRYDKVPDPRDASQILIKVTAEITNSRGDRIDEKFAELRDTSLIAGMLGSTVALPPAAPREKRNEILQKSLDKPSFSPEGTLIRSAADRPFGVEILVTGIRDAPQDAKGWARVPARSPRSEDGQPFVDIKRDEVYAIRIHNDFKHDNEPYEAAVLVAIDGIDVFNYSQMRDPKTRKPKYTHYVCPQGQCTICGWHKTNEQSDSFLVTEFGKGAASRAKVARGKIGVITVKFALAWAGNDVPAPEKGARDAGNETGFGPPIRTQLKEVERHVGVVRDVISVRYSRRNRG
jgi:hypothetical protein